MNRVVFSSHNSILRAALVTLIAAASAACAPADEPTSSLPETPEKQAAGASIGLPGPGPTTNPDPGWSLETSASPLALTSVSDSSYADVYVIRGSKGIKNVPLAADVKRELYDDWSGEQDESAVYMVSPKAIEAIQRSIDNGELDEDLRELSEEQSSDPVKLGGPCGDEVRVASRYYPLSFSFNKNQNFGSGFSGGLNLSASVSGGATVALSYLVRRQKVLFACIPYWVKAESVRASGGLQAQANDGIDGNISGSYSWSQEVAKPTLGALDFMVGPVPVHLGFNLPITLGLDLSASASGALHLQGQDTVASASFDYTCTWSGCNGSSSFSMPTPASPSNLSGGVSARINADIWADVGVRTFLYTEEVAYAQVGVRPHLIGDLWGYYGNNCGDADGDGVNETVNAATLDLDWRVNLTAKAGVFGSEVLNNADLWHSQQRHIGFWPLTSSTALTPMLQGPASVSVGASATYTPKMRPCWPYGETVSGDLGWGDGSASGVATPGAVSHAWGSRGDFTATLNASTDAHGRKLGRATSRLIHVQ